MRGSTLGWVLVIAALLLPAAARAEIVLAAPAEIAPLINDLLTRWREGGGPEVRPVYGNSDDQAIEIEMGERSYDLLLAADPHAFYRVASKGLIGNPLPLASSSLILVLAGRDPSTPPADDIASQQGPLAIVDPEAGGVGSATRDILSQNGQWERLQGRLLLLPGGRAVIRALEQGAAPAGIALRADLARARDLREGASLEGDAPPPDYVYAIAATAPPRAELLRFLGFLRSAPAGDIFSAHGFIPERAR